MRWWRRAPATTNSRHPDRRQRLQRGIDQVVNPSDKKGGTLSSRTPVTGTPSTRATPTTAYSWNFARLYGRSLTMFKSAPGKEGNQLVPDLAEALASPVDDAKTWTYKLRKGVKFEDGTAVTSAGRQVRGRALDRQADVPERTDVLEGILDLPRATRVPYKTPDMNTDSAIETPDEYTIVFHLKQPFAAFDYFAQLPDTMPVPQGQGHRREVQGTRRLHRPYMFADVQPGKSFNLVRNDQWDPATDPNRKALPDASRSQLNVNADDIDNRLITGDLDVDVAGTGVQPAAQSRVLQTRRSRRTRTTRSARGSGTPRSTRRLRRWTTSTAARPSSTPWTTPATRPPTAASSPVGTSQRRSCRRASRATQSSTSSQTVRTTRATSTRPRSH